MSMYQGLIDQIIQQQQQPQPVPQTRTFGGFRGGQGQLLPTGQYSRMAQGLLGNHRSSPFIDPGAAWNRPPQQPPQQSQFPDMSQMPGMPPVGFGGMFGSMSPELLQQYFAGGIR